MAGAVKMQVKVLMAVLVMMVVATSVGTADARLDFSQILGSSGIQTDSYVTRDQYRGGSPASCCKLCFCSMSKPLRCRCGDVKSSCYEGCQDCLCIESWCRCNDIHDFCYKPCTTTTTAEN